MNAVFDRLCEASGWAPDAAYLELALRRNLPLATLDPDLRTAANLENVHLLGV